MAALSQDFWKGIIESGHVIAISLRILLIVVGAWIVHRIVARLIRTFRKRLSERMDSEQQRKRAETLGRVFRYLAMVIISVGATILVLSELGVSVAPILGAAGVVGLAVGFGAQSLVKDYFTGFFILLENQITNGDIVEIAGKSGVVEDVTLRYVRLRDYDGNVHYVPNNLITTVTNMSHGFAFAVVNVGVAYRENLDEVFQVIHEVAHHMAADQAYSAKILEPLEMAGVDEWGDSAIVVRCRFKTAPSQQWGVRREFLRRLKVAFDEHGIEIPYPHMTIYAGADKAGRAPPFKVEPAAEESPAA